VWDDHESANDSCVESASNHTPDEGQWAVRKRAAIQAYLEWMPIRDPSNGGIARSFRFGDLADLVMLDTRLAGRDVQVDRADPTATADPRRSLLGRAQEDWLAQQLVRSRDDGVAWRLVGQQIPMGQLRTEESQPWSSDMWDGYDAARRRFLDHLDAEAIRDVVVMTGDIHSSWAMELCRDPFSADARERQPLAVELITPAVSSPSPIPADEVDGVVELLMRTHPHIGWVELEHRGYVDVDLDPERLRARWMHVSTVAERDATTRVAHELEVRRGEPRLRPRARPE
jgi:alkaline phosphatase D